MAESHVVSGLVAKRAELAGQIQHYQTMIQRLTADLGHIDAAILLFDPEFDLRRVRGKAQRERSQYFVAGEGSKLALDVLRMANGEAVCTRQVAVGMLQSRGIAPESIETWKPLLKGALATLKRLEKKGLVVMAGLVPGIGKSAMTWRVA